MSDSGQRKTSTFEREVGDLESAETAMVYRIYGEKRRTEGPMYYPPHADPVRAPLSFPFLFETTKLGRNEVLHAASVLRQAFASAAPENQCMFVPGIAIEATVGRGRVAFLVCFQCHEIMVASSCAPYRGHLFGANGRASLVALCRSFFPQDAALAALE